MGLDLYPTPYPCKTKGIAKLNSNGTTNCACTKCWFKDDNNPSGVFGTDCWFRGKALAHELEAFGEDKLAARCYKSVTAEKADAFGKRLLELVAKLRKRYEGVPPEELPHDAGWDLSYSETSKEWLPGDFSTFEEALETIEQGGNWYRKVAGLGSGVEAWY